MRIVIDTNILVSFAIRPNPAFERLFDLIAVHHVMLVSEETAAELLDVLTREKFQKYLPLDQSLDYVALAEQVPIMWMKLGMLPRKSGNVCISKAALVERTCAHGDNDRHRSMVAESNA